MIKSKAAYAAMKSAAVVANAARIVMKADKECKGSVRYASADPDAPITNVYLSRKAYATMPAAIGITIDAA